MKNRSERKIWALLPLVLGTGVALHAQSATTGSEENKDETVKLEKLEVTGSRIPRLDTETVSPVQTLSAASLEQTGFTTIGDALRSLSFNSGQALTPTDSGTSFTPGVSTINLRGLGNNSTLVLINGRRAVPYAAPGFDGLQTVFDLESIPDAAIDRVEILKDGGSAIYGSDAVGGVVNFILKKDFDGLSTSLEIGDYFRTGGLYKAASVVTGAHSGKNSLFVSANWKEQDAVYARDLPWSSNADQTDRAHKADPKYRWIGWQNTGMGFTSESDALDYIGALDPVADGWFDNRSSRGFPGYVKVPGVGTRTFDSPTDTPTQAGASVGYNPYNYQEAAGLFPSYRKYAIFSRAQHDFNPSLYGFVELGFTRTEAQSAAAPTLADIESSHGLSPGSSMVLPSYNAYNPWGVDITAGRRRLVEIGDRINDVTSDTPRILVGLGGDLASVPALETWKWEAGALYTKNTVTNLNKGSVADSALQEALNGLTRNADGSLSWDPTTPQSDRVYYNWFGYNEQAFTDFLTIDNPNVATLEYKNYDISAGGDVMEFDGGKLGLSLGAEHRTEKLADIKTLLNERGDILGGSEGTSAYGDRTVSSVYGEADLQLFGKLLEFQVAGRFEKYSDDGFEQKVRPKIGVKVRPTDWLLLRASYSQAFKAPDLSYLYAASSTSFTSYQIVDPVTGTQIDQLQIVTSGNPDLKPEVTDIYYAGFTLDAPGALKGLQLDVDGFYYKQKGLLAQLSDFYGYDQFLGRASKGDPLFSDKVVRDPNTNEVLYIKDLYANISSGKYEGIDTTLSYKWTTNSMGEFNASVSTTWLNKLEIDGDNIVGGWLTARWNGTAALNWKYRDWGVSMYETYRGKRTRLYDVGYGLTDNDEVYVQYTVKAQYTTNMSVTYSGFESTKITVGVDNLLNQDPPVDPFEGSGSTPGINDETPAFWYVRIAKDF